MKQLLLILPTLFICALQGQSLYVRSETTLYGLPSFIANMSNAKEESFYLENKYKTSVVTKGGSQTNIVTMNGATVLNTTGRKTECASSPARK